MTLPDHYPGIDEAFEPHSYAEIFPMLSLDELEELAASIEHSGQQSPVVLYDGRILDGRNRYAALSLLNKRLKQPIKLIYGRFEAGSENNPETDHRALDYVVIHNLHRRSLTVGQRAAIGLELKAQYAIILRNQEEKYKSSKQAAKDVGVSARAIEQAQTIEEEAPELLKEVKSGKRSLNSAYAQIKPRQTKTISLNTDLVVDFITQAHSLDEDEVVSCLNSLYDYHPVSYTHLTLPTILRV